MRFWKEFMKKYFYRELVEASLIRATRTAITTLVSGIGTMALVDIDWPALLYCVVIATVVNFLTCICAGLPEVN